MKEKFTYPSSQSHSLKKLLQLWHNYQKTGEINSQLFSQHFINVQKTDLKMSDILNAEFQEYLAIWKPIFEHKKIGKAIYQNLPLEVSENFLKKLCQFLSPSADLSNLTIQKWVGEILFTFKNSLWLKKVADAQLEENWFSIYYLLIQAGNFNIGSFIRTWTHHYKANFAFQYKKNEQVIYVSWDELFMNILRIGSWLDQYFSKNQLKPHLAILSDNRIEMVVVDLACLCFGFIDIMVPINAVYDDMEYIIQDGEASILFVSNETRLTPILPHLSRLQKIEKIIIFDLPSSPVKEPIIPYSNLIDNSRIPAETELDQIFQRTKVTDLATIMYTSGTTGKPKGIMFSHLNVISKRFARALVWPSLNEKDTFLSYLPLYHTFGRWLEMMGSLFWGSTYVFSQSPTIGQLIQEMKSYHPTVFISIPQKWQQIFETIEKKIDLHSSSNEKIQSVVKKYTGGKLRMGLSAAGYLDPDIFKFFQHNGIDLMSGFGMTEATGGITMTPPGHYKENSLGKILPGIQVKFAEDGELMVRGPYIMMGYWNTNPEENPLNTDGWLPSGDIMRKDTDDYIYILDRKKEIYKNVKGQTIAPQRIENYFRDFEAIKRVFLVGDQREYNTLLIYPNYEYSEINLFEMAPSELQNLFGSLVVSVNQFLAPFERIVNFTIINQDFSREKEELTPKGTYRRKNIEKNYKDVIEHMYRTHQVILEFQNFQLSFPNWLLRELGILEDEVQIDGTQNLTVQGKPVLELQINSSVPNLIRLGNLWYYVEKQPIDLGKILSNPSLWLTNHQLVNLSKENIFKWIRIHEDNSDITIARNEKPVCYTFPSIWKDFEKTYKNQVFNLKGLHLSGQVIQFGDLFQASTALEYLVKILDKKTSSLGYYGQQLFCWAIVNQEAKIKRKAFLILNSLVDAEKWYDLFRLFFEADPNFLDKITNKELSKESLKDPNFNQLLIYIRKNVEPFFWQGEPAIPNSIINLFRFIEQYVSLHPIKFKIVRQLFTDLKMNTFNPKLTQLIQNVLIRIEATFRNWLGKNSPISIDPDLGQEYSWDQVIVFDEIVPENHQQLLTNLISQTSFVREALFLFTDYIFVDLNDLPPNGIWITLIGELHGKSVYRISVQTRYQGRYDIAANLITSLTAEQVSEEISWLIICGYRANLPKIVEDMGGYWPEFHTWSEEYIPGETVDIFLHRITRQQTDYQKERLKDLWPFIIWSACNVYLDFWDRTGRRYEVADPTPLNIIVPHHDYQTGSRIISISSRRLHKNIWNLIFNIYEQFVKKIETSYPFLKDDKNWIFIFSSMLEILGENEGLKHLKSIDDSSILTMHKNMIRNKIIKYIGSVKKKGFLPLQLYFAIQRFKRWKELNPKATARAEISNLIELYRTYNLQYLEKKYPKTRVCFYRETVFSDANPDLQIQLDQLLQILRQQNLSNDEIEQYISTLQSNLQLTKREKYLLTRLGFIHLKPTDAAEMLTLETGDQSQTTLVIKFQDREGEQFRIRSPLNPKEVARLQRLFHQSNLVVSFQPQDQFLLVFNQNDQLIGGLFYHKHNNETVNLEKIVIADHYRRKWVSSGLLDEFFKRMKGLGYSKIKTGFFRPEFFYRFGFHLEKGYAGLVKNLDVKEV